MEEGHPVPRFERFSLSIDSKQRTGSRMARHSLEEGDSTCGREGGYHGKDRGLAHFPPLVGNEPAVSGHRYQDRSGTLRHANSRITLDLYTQAVSTQKREANAKVVEMLLPSPKPQHIQHHRRLRKKRSRL